MSTDDLHGGLRGRRVVSDVLAALAEQANAAAPGALASVIGDVLRPIGVRSVEVLLADYESEWLVGVAAAGGVNGRTEPVGGSSAGACFRGAEPVDDPDGETLWCPVIERGHVLGVLAVRTPEITAQVRASAQSVASLAGQMLAAADRYTDAYQTVRERKDLSTSAALQWGHLPPESFASAQIVIGSTVEPAYDIAGDGYDYSVGTEAVDFALVDAMGHGLDACLDNLIAVTTLRSCRRDGRSLPEMGAALADAMRGRRAHTTFATAVVGRMGLDEGELTWINAGHPPPWIVGRDGGIRCLGGEVRPPAGALSGERTPDYPVMEDVLHPGEMLVVISDGVMDIADPDASTEGVVRRVAETYAESPGAARTAVRAVAREVLDRDRGHLRDDATILMLARPVRSGGDLAGHRE